MAKKTPQRRGMALLRGLAPRLTTEESVPQDPLSIDGSIPANPRPSTGWGPLSALLANSLVIVEYYSRRPNLVDMASALAKLHIKGYEHHRDRANGRPAPPRPPTLLVFSNGRPRAALQGLEFELVAPWLIESEAHAGARIFVLDLKRLPSEDNYRALRLLRSEANVTVDEIRALHDDPEFVDSDKDRFVKAMMKYEHYEGEPTNPEKPVTAFYRRLEAERYRVQAERDRVQAERDRVQAERDRERRAMLRAALEGRGVELDDDTFATFAAALAPEDAAEVIRRAVKGESLDDFLP